MKLRFSLLWIFALSVSPAALGGTLLRTSFETSDWLNRSVSTSLPAVTASASYGNYGTIDVQTDVANNAADVVSKGLLFSINSSGAGASAWKASLGPVGPCAAAVLSGAITPTAPERAA